jgi:hypothetical protein
MMTSIVPRNGKNSLTFESVVCTQLELQRRAASFSHRRNTMCRRPSSLSSSSNRIMLLPPSSSPPPPYSSSRISTSALSDITVQFLKTRNSNCSKQSRTSSMNSISGGRISSATDRQSFISMFYSDTPSRSTTSKKV